MAMLGRFALWLASTLLVLAAACSASNQPARQDAGTPSAPAIRLNQIQVLGTHNSYHVAPAPPLLSAIASYSKELADSVEYTHAPLAVQLGQQHIRQIELDVFADPDGGLYARPAGQAALGAAAPVAAEMTVPGFKVLHSQDIDFGSTCPTFVACLKQVKDWSDASPDHVPLLIMVEFKDEPIPDPYGLGFVTPRKIGASEMDALDAEIRSVFSAAKLLAPDDLRKGNATLEAAILKDGWPALNDVRGRVMFALVNEGDLRSLYTAGRPSLEGRVMFTSSRPGQPDAAFVKLDDALTGASQIRDLVSAGYLVRTRADIDTKEARTGDTRRRDAALASGAQFVSTDYPVADPSFATGYAVTLGGAGLRCNPVNAPAGCRDADLESAAAVGRALHSLSIGGLRPIVARQIADQTLPHPCRRGERGVAEIGERRPITLIRVQLA